MAAVASTRLSWLLGLLLLLFVRSSNSTGTSSSSSSSTATATSSISTSSGARCTAISRALPRAVFFAGSKQYRASTQSYFSLQEAQLSPACIVRPSCTEDVATTIKILSALRGSNTSQTPEKAEFAVRSGGHTAWAGAANVNDGVTIDLGLLNGISLAADHKSVLVGAGTRWGDIYTQLDPLKLAIVGGRASAVGVGGLTLGGGNSFFSPRYGFVCDNVLSYEVVLADGSVVNATADSKKYSDLFVALRGGTQNFGIVTRFQLFAFPQGQLLGGSTYYNVSTAPQQLEALYKLAGGNGSTYDPYASVIQSYGLSGAQGSAATNSLTYTKPVAKPATFSGFNAIPSFASSVRITNLSTVTTEQGASSSNGFRELYITTTFKNNLAVLQTGFNLWNASLAAVRNVPGIVWSLSYEPLPTAITTRAASKGGNSLGLTGAEGDLMIALLTATWNRTADDALLRREAVGMFKAIDAAAAKAGAAVDYRYLNYALDSQRPIASYGAASVAHLQAASRKYDPTGLFQAPLSGSPGFKVFG